MADTATDSTNLWADYNKQDIVAQAQAKIAAQADDGLDKDAFLQLMVKQLQYQDPLNPMDNQAFLAQMAQFTALEQMQNMNATTLQTQAFSMMGRVIEANVYNEATQSYDDILGAVSSVVKHDGQTYLMVGQKQVPADKVDAVYSDPLAAMGSLMNTTQNLSLIGKTVQAITTDSTLRTTAI